MKPLGRKPIQLPGAKHHPKEDGKNVPGWWEDHHTDSNTSARQKVKKDIVNQIAEKYLNGGKDS